MMQIIRILLPFCLLYCAESASFFKYQPGSVKLGTRLPRDLSERQLHLTIEDRRETLSIKKQLLPGISKRPSRRNARCLKQSTNGYSYITSKRAVYVENDESLKVPSVDQLLKIREAINRKTGAEAGEHSRKRRKTTMSKGKQSLITPTISSDTAFIKIRMMMDVAFFNRFLDFVGGDIDEAKSEIECFLTLVINQAALYYASLKDLGSVISSSDGQQYNVDFLPYLEGITFPPQNQDGSFYDIPPLVNNREGRFLITKIFDSGENNISFDVDGLVIDFGEYQSANFPGQQPFNLIHFMSGDYFTFDIYNRISNDSNDDIFVTRIVFEGVSYIGCLCGNFEGGNFDGRNGFSSLNSAGIGRLVAHEIGHNIGCFHDISERCPPEKVTLMSTVYAPPTAAAGEDYYKWSNCSGEEIENYFAFLNLTSAQIANCLFTEYPSEEDFLSNFCKGLLGTRYGLNETCQLVFGNDSYLCTNGSSNMEAGYVDADKCQTTNGPGGFFDPLPLLYCSKDDSCDDSTNTLLQVFDGTKCTTKGGKTKGKQVCYRGECVETLQVCKESVGKSKGKEKK